MRVGFTGTRDGMTFDQERALAGLLHDLWPAEFHHGACVGADARAVRVMDRVWAREPPADRAGDSLKTVAHPSDLPGMTDATAIARSDEIRPERPPLDRNRDIVDACPVLIACPKSTTEERRSGTWMTVRYARKRGRRVIIIWPHGSVYDPGGAG